MEFRGEVAFINDRKVTSKKTGRTYTAYNIKLKLDNGELSEALDNGFEKPTVNKGDYVVVIAEKDDKGYFKVTDVNAAERPKQRTAPATAESSSPALSDAADRQTQIVLQHSQDVAVATVQLLIANDALPLSAATSKAGATKRFEEIVKAIDKLTVQRYFDVVTARLLDSVADAGDVDVAEVGEIPPAQKDSTTTTSGEDD